MTWRTIHRSHHHLRWNREIPPIATVAPGETFAMECLEASGGVIARDSTAADIARLDPDRANPVTGPVYIDGARPGDVLAVELLDFALSGWGWTAIIPGLGLLADQFTEPFLLISEHNGDLVALVDGVRLPTRPFCGTIGVAPARGVWPLIPPLPTGGNIDCKSVTAGSTLLLPVEVEGALLSVGDPHAAQGDGEVCGTAVESPMTVRLRATIRRDRTLTAPQIEAPFAEVAGGPRSPQPPHRTGFHITTGVNTDLMAAARDAISAMIDHLGREYRLDAQTAYCICSTAVDLRIAELVNAPHYTLAAQLPLAIFR